MRLFVDTGALTALNAPRDPYHARAVEFLRSLPAGTRLTTNNLVFTETVTLMAVRYGQDAAVIATVKAEGLDGVFGFDEDFARCGLKLYPPPCGVK